MRYRPFGRTGWQTSEIGFGTWGMGGWTGSDDGESLHAMERALALGCNFFDTAWVYGQGKSEQLLGQALRLARPELVEGRARSGQAQVGPYTRDRVGADPCVGPGATSQSA